ncbi:hypothetical protein ACIGO9_28510 [Nocardia asteroides]|uniref:hypothetical protein n=1 Tax=Nocardia asteroides TaxID=1824 RepID=UPI0037CA1AA5
MRVSVTCTVYRILGIPIGSVTREHSSTTVDEYRTPAMPPKPVLTDHGYAYQCSHCGELLLEGLKEPIAAADELELALRHACKDTP